MKAKIQRKIIPEVQLSIVMIMKNAERTLGKCLDSLKSLRERFSNELIIADTGSTDRSVEIAQRYTDQVFPFTWIDDFSAARNATLDRAHGAWILMIDSDEWYESTAAVEAFLADPPEGVAGAGVIQRNYTAPGSSAHQDALVLRIFKNLPEHRYQGTIHEQIERSGPVVQLSDFMHHVGYFDPVQKAQRNLPLLRRQVAENPRSVKVLYQMIEECMAVDLDEALACTDSLLDILQGSPSGAGLSCAVYAKRLRIFNAKEDYASVLSNGKACLEAYEKPAVAHLDICAMLGMVCVKAGLYGEAIRYLKRYFDLFQLHLEGKMDAEERLFYTPQHGTSDALKRNVIRYGICCARLGHDEELLRVFDWLRADDVAWQMEPDLIGAVFTAALKRKEYERAYQVYALAEMWKDEKALEIARAQIRRLLAKAEDAWEVLKEAFSEGTPDVFVLLLRLDQADLRGAFDMQLYEQILSLKYTAEEAGWLVYLAVKNGQNPLRPLAAVDVDEAQTVTQALFDCRVDSHLLMRAYLESAPEAETLLALRWELSLLERTLIEVPRDEALEGLDEQARADAMLCTPALFERYARSFTRYVHETIAPALLTEEGIQVLPCAYRFAYYMGESQRQREAGNMPDSIALLRKATTVYPVMLPYVRRDLEWLRAEQEQEAEQEMLRRSESLLIKRQIKMLVRQMIERGEMAAAVQALNAYEDKFPGDDELAYLWQMVEAGPVTS